MRVQVCVYFGYNIIMSKKKDITASEKQKITKLLSDGMTSLNILKLLGRDHRTIKKTTEDIAKNRKPRSGKGSKNLSTTDKRELKCIAAKNPLLSCDKTLGLLV
ncbi:Hypothetical predicted protein [Octopus vulgaris]|uniref:Transposase IS30-like HTH domain-containing protein n=1 Tax=Octopus vulgaris TaxID=6645 RepID=A0AA36F426_OCTVU|nr:Hypothetical predicted protein [Octopus vulgaris]